MDEMYAADTSKKIRAVVQAKAKAGERVTTNPPYGYLKDSNNPKNWIVDPVASEVVKRIFQEAKSGKSLSEIAKGLENDKIFNQIQIYQRDQSCVYDSEVDQISAAEVLHECLFGNGTR